MRVTILGCGGSGGVPLVGGRWGECDPADPRNRRRRPSILVEWRDKVVLVDTGPDMREQLLDAGVARLDAVLYTHAHADHVHGIDDLRSLWRRDKALIDVYGSAEVIETLMHRFSYLFEGAGSADAFYRPVLMPHAIEGTFTAAGLPVASWVQAHGGPTSLGFRFGPFAYSTDAVDLPEDAFAALAGIDVWVVDCLRAEPPHPTHAHLDKTLEWIAQVKPRQAWLTHMNHQADYRKLAALCPPGVMPAHDGLVLEIPDPEYPI